MVADFRKYADLKEKPLKGNWNGEIFWPANGFRSPHLIRYEIIRDMEEIRASFHLRYITFRYVNFIEENEDCLDIDPYDLYSTFLGAYDITGKEKILAGTLRIINPFEKGEASPHVEELIGKARDQRIRNLGQRPKFFPTMESFPELENYFDCLAEAEGQKIAEYPYEISRLAIRPDYWMHNADIGLHHLLILDSWLHNTPRNHFLIAVHPRSRRRYEKVGFKIIPGTGEVLYKHINQLAIAMIIDLKEFLREPRWYRQTCESLFPGFAKNGHFTRVLNARKVFTSDSSQSG